MHQSHAVLNVSVRATHVDAGSRWVEFVFSQRRRRRRRESWWRTFVQQETAARQTVLPKIPVNEHGIMVFPQSTTDQN